MGELFGLEKKLLVGRYFCMVNIAELKWGRGSKKNLEPFSVNRCDAIISLLL